MSNFAFNNPAFQQQDPRNVATYPGASQGGQGTYAPPPAPGAAQTASFQHGAMDAAANAQLEGMYTAPAAGAHETDRMTVEDTVWKTAGLFGILLVTAAIGWVWTMASAATGQANLTPWIIGALGGFVLAMVITFTSRKKVRPALIFGYAAFEGLFIGGISAFFELLWPGVVLQATLATVAVVGVTLALFASGKVRASAKMTKIFMIAMIGYLVFSLLNIVLMWTGVSDNPWGLRGEIEFFGIPLGVIIGVLVVFMAAYSLVLDFDQIQQGVRNGAPRKYGWLGAFGIMVTVVWLYVEILRILAILRGND
ncbi:Bax inhibitor-1/YccA family protein [Microbacterium sp. NPDC058342]|uniref:Bax inhibitor-1/YccA family protein n=1 Tax=Microbacterium sp. NPDC058342 TaxID=3346454 RepID=UPI00365AD276